MPRKGEKFCNPSKYQVMIPYQDLVRLVEFADKMEQTEQKMQRLEDQLTALQGLYSELLEKVAELNRYV